MMNSISARLRRPFLIVTLMLATSSMSLCSVAWAQKVLLVPFTIYAEGDLTFLQKGVQSMLATRLGQDQTLTVVELTPEAPELAGISGALDEAAAATLANGSGADYVAFGTITILGDSISTDARFFDATARETKVAFSKAGKTQGDAILHINEFAAQVNADVFGKGLKSQATVAPAPDGQAAAPASRANPEATWRKQFGIAVSENPTGTEPSALLWKSGNFRENIRGLAVADVDGDGNAEVVMGGEKNILIHRMAGGGFQRVAQVPVDHWIRIIGVEAMDINTNGVAEIFVSATDDKFRASSYVLEWDGSQFVRIEESSRWYYRVVADPATGQGRLYGQQGGFREPLYDTVFELGWSDGRYVPMEKQFVPGKSNVFGFAYGDVMNTGEPVVVSFVKGDNLQITLPSGREEWTSADKYGGRADYLVSSEEYVQLQRESRSNPDPEPMERDWLFHRVIIADLDGDQAEEVLVVMNHDRSGGLFHRIRSYVKGRFECLEWDNVGLQPKWRTRYFTGYISDYALADPDNDGRQELIFCVVKQVGDPITGKKVSYIVVWKPDQEMGKHEAKPAS